MDHYWRSFRLIHEANFARAGKIAVARPLRNREKVLSANAELMFIFIVYVRNKRTYYEA